LIREAVILTSKRAPSTRADLAGGSWPGDEAEPAAGSANVRETADNMKAAARDGWMNSLEIMVFLLVCSDTG
jgi:hypothetical protein